MDIKSEMRNVIYNPIVSKAVEYNGNSELRGITSKTGNMLNLENGAIYGEELTIRMMSEDVPGIKQGDTIRIDGVDRYVLSVRPQENSGTVRIYYSDDEVIA